MSTIRNLSTALLLAGTALGAPIFAGSWTQPKNDVVATLAPRDYVSDRILYVTTTITIPYGSTAPTLSPTAVVSVPSMAHSTMTASVVPVAASSPVSGNTQAAASMAPIATSSPALKNTQASMPSLVATVASSPAAAQASGPAASPTPAVNVASSGSSLTADIIKMIMPLSGSCAGRDPQAGSCRTADQAAAPLAKAFSTYGITSKGAQAANLALIAYESSQMMYKVGLDPSTPGKGTYAVMLPPNVQKYATQLYGAAAVTNAATPVAILALVNTKDDDAFGAASWYMSTQCPSAQALFNGDVDTAWTSYISSCVGGSDLAGRQPFWDAAKKAFSL
jgi:hypothetical protein